MVRSQSVFIFNYAFSAHVFVLYHTTVAFFPLLKFSPYSPVDYSSSDSPPAVLICSIHSVAERVPSCLPCLHISILFPLLTDIFACWELRMQVWMCGKGEGGSHCSGPDSWGSEAFQGTPAFPDWYGAMEAAHSPGTWMSAQHTQGDSVLFSPCFWNTTPNHSEVPKRSKAHSALTLSLAERL